LAFAGGKKKTKPVNGQVYQNVFEFGFCQQTDDTEVGMLFVYRQDGA
jgi:hypothetical protein